MVTVDTRVTMSTLDTTVTMATTRTTEIVTEMVMGNEHDKTIKCKKWETFQFVWF
jgi:hypothetical protein